MNEWKRLETEAILTGANPLSTLLFATCLVAGLGGSIYFRHPGPLIAGSLLGAYFLSAVKVAKQWERVVVLRFGRYLGLRGPGLFLIIPVVDSLSRFVDQRVRVTNVNAEAALTRDTVPVNVDAIVFWVVWNAEKCILEVADFEKSIAMSAQTALLESIGRHELAQMITERESLGRELQRILDEKTSAWGITVQSVEIRDVHIPPALEDAMSRQAQGGKGAAGSYRSGNSGSGDLRQVRRSLRALPEQSSCAALARHEHALRSNKRKGFNGDCAFFSSRKHESGRANGD